MLATASAQVCVPLGHSSLYFLLFSHMGKCERNSLMNNDQKSRKWQHKETQVYVFLNGETKTSDNNHALLCSISQLLCRCGGEETNIKDYTRLFEVDSSHMTVKLSRLNLLKSTWGHFSFKWGHISWPQRLAGALLRGPGISSVYQSRRLLQQQYWPTEPRRYTGRSAADLYHSPMMSCCNMIGQRQRQIHL